MGRKEIENEPLLDLEVMFYCSVAEEEVACFVRSKIENGRRGSESELPKFEIVPNSFTKPVTK